MVVFWGSFRCFFFFFFFFGGGEFWFLFWFLWAFVVCVLLEYITWDRCLDISFFFCLLGMLFFFQGVLKQILTQGLLFGSG